MSPFQSRKVAAAVTAVAVTASVLAGSHRSLTALRRGVEKTIVQGADGSGYSIATDGRDMAAIGRDLMTVAGRYLPAGEPLFDALEDACLELEEAKDLFDWRNGAQGVRAAATGLLARLAERTDVTERDRRYLAGFDVDLEAALHRMSCDPYNDAARDFNENILGTFPASVLGPLTGVRPLETF